MKIPKVVLNELDRVTEQILEVLPKKEYLVSIIVFGSAVKGEYMRGVSDLDYLIVFDNSCPKTVRRKVEKLIRGNSEVNFLRKLEIMSGIKVSGFITTISALERRDFSAIFNVNSILSKIFAPKSLVFKSIYTTSYVYYGVDLRYLLNPVKIRRFDIIKSLIISLIVFVFGILNLKSGKWKLYVREALKWSIFNCHTFVYGYDLSAVCDAQRLIKCQKLLDIVIQVFNLKLRASNLPMVVFILVYVHVISLFIYSSRIIVNYN